MIVAVNALDIYLPFHDQHGQLFLAIVSIAPCSPMLGRHTDVDVGLVPFEDRRESSVLGCISTKDLLDGIDAPLLGEDDSGGPDQGSACSDKTRHLLTEDLPWAGTSKQERRLADNGGQYTLLIAIIKKFLERRSILL